MKTKFKILLALLILLFINSPLFSSTEDATYTTESHVYLEKVTWHNSAAKWAMKISTLSMFFDLHNADIQLNLNIDTQDMGVRFVESGKNEWGSRGRIEYLVYVEDVLCGSGRLDTINQTLFDKKLKLKEKNIKVEFYLVPEQQSYIKEDRFYDIIGVDNIKDIQMTFSTSKGDQIAVNGSTGPTGILTDSPIVNDNGEIDHVPVGEPELSPIPLVLIDSVDNPNINTSSLVKVADLYAYWEDQNAVANSDVLITISPENGNSFVLVHQIDSSQTIPYLLTYKGDVVSDGGETYTETLTTSNTINNKKLLGDINVRLNMSQNELLRKPAGVYTNTILITISPTN